MPLSRIAASSISTGSITGTQIANNTIPIEEFANTGTTAVFSPSANTVAIRTTGITRVTVKNSGNTDFANSVSISAGAVTSGIDNYPLIVGKSNGLPTDSLQPNAAVVIADTLSSRRMGLGTHDTGVWIQSSYPGVAGPAYPISLNPNGGNVGVNTSNPSSNFDVNAETTWQNGVMRKNGVNSFQSINRRVRVELSNYAYCRFRLFALRTNSDNSTVYWEGLLNNNFNTSYSTAFNSRTSSGTISYSFGTSSSGVWNWDFNNTGSGAILWYTLESPGYGTVTMTTY